MPVKSARAKKAPVRTISKPEKSEEEEVIDLRAQAIKKPVEFDLADPTAVDEDAKSDPLAPTDESDELASDDAALDDEELNPFGDKWEM